MNTFLVLICLGLIVYILKGKFSKNKKISDWKDTLSVIAEKSVPAEFDYWKQDKESETRTVDVEKILLSEKGHYYLYGICRDSNEPRYFRGDRISGLINSDDVLYRVNDFIEMMKES